MSSRIKKAICSLLSRKKAVQQFTLELKHPEWAGNCVMYEVNIRQFTGPGTFKAFEKHLPRLRDMGIDILWFMPTFPIGIKNRKGNLGSYYSVRDYYRVNMEFGTVKDLKSLIEKIHRMGMYILLDWIPNHSSWDNNLTIEYPEWYVRDPSGNFIPPHGTDWSDVIQLDWSRKELHDYMIDAMKFWVNMGVDGFRVDHPDKTPREFWEKAREELDRIKPVFMLAEYEGDKDFLKRAFDMDYAWEMYHIMVSIAGRKKNARVMHKYFKKQQMSYPNNAYRLLFLTNHDENSWAGTVNSLMGEAECVFGVLIFTAQGMPLIYSGQEVCLDRKLKFYEKDEIKWETCHLTEFYSHLIRLKKKNEALWNGDSGGEMMKIKTGRSRKILAFYREKSDNRVVVMLNLSDKKVKFKAAVDGIEGTYTEYFTGRETDLLKSVKFVLNPYGYMVFIR